MTRTTDRVGGELRRAVRGPIVTPGSPDYPVARRVWNGAIDRRPAAIAYCLDEPDVVAALRAARELELPIAVRCGGHSIAGWSIVDDGVVIDLSRMNRVAVDPGSRLAQVSGGALNEALDVATQEHGLATTAGIVSHTGLGGLALGGGIGWLMRAHGAACDNIAGARLVTHDGSALEVTRDHELMWALRGAGANLGVVTRLDLELHPVGPLVIAGALVYPADRAPAVLRGYRGIAVAAPRELGSIVVLRHAPPAPWLPHHIHGRPVVIVAVCWCGDHDAGVAALRPLRDLAPIVDTVGPVPYCAHQRMFDAGVPHGLRYVWRSDYVADLTEPVLDALVAQAWDMRSARSYTIVFHLGGAMADRAGNSVFTGRSGYAVNINGAWADGESEDSAWVLRTWSALHVQSSGVYVNFLADENSDRVATAYGGPAAMERLRAMKRRYDPDNVFRGNHNIR